jgi:hypothetical protein
VKVVLFFLIAVFVANAKEPIISQVTSIQPQIKMVPNPKAKPGMEAFVIHDFDDSHSSIVGQCTVAKSPDTLECKPFERLEQDSLSQMDRVISFGDKVVIGLLLDEGMVIAPNQESFMRAQKLLQDYHLLHIDMFANLLYAKDEPMPTREGFSTFCEQNFVGSLFFVFADKIQHVDCLTFTPLGHYPFERNTKEFTSPFFHRISTIERSWYDFRKEVIEDFDIYYTNLIENKDN